MKQITKLEFQFIRDMISSDHTTDGQGIVMWVSAGYCSMNPKQWRAIVTSLEKKGIIHYSESDPGYKWTWDYENDRWDDRAQNYNDMNYLFPPWVSLAEEHQKESDLSWDEIKELVIEKDENGYYILDTIDDNFQKACTKWSGYEIVGLEVKE
tara:strand:+ start:2565 stop:3023 length:459 start_codon:yes stop_codon:yes gene_type:complete